jgi:hypothetical protein
LISTVYGVVLALNALWFGAGFWYFGLVPARAAKIVAAKAQRATPLFETLAASLRFLGGMNFAFSAFSLLLLFSFSLFPEARQRALFAAVFAMAHASQFVSNLPVALAGGRRGDALWDVLKGPMLFIFAVDALLMLVNAVLALVLLA